MLGTLLPPLSTATLTSILNNDPLTLAAYQALLYEHCSCCSKTADTCLVSTKKQSVADCDLRMPSLLVWQRLDCPQQQPAYCAIQHHFLLSWTLLQAPHQNNVHANNL